MFRNEWHVTLLRLRGWGSSDEFPGRALEKESTGCAECMFSRTVGHTCVGEGKTGEISELGSRRTGGVSPSGCVLELTSNPYQ